MTPHAPRTLSDLRRDDTGVSSLKGAAAILAVAVLMGGLSLAHRTGPGQACHRGDCPSAHHDRVAP